MNNGRPARGSKGNANQGVGTGESRFNARKTSFQPLVDIPLAPLRQEPWEPPVKKTGFGTPTHEA